MEFTEKQELTLIEINNFEATITGGFHFIGDYEFYFEIGKQELQSHINDKERIQNEAERIEEVFKLWNQAYSVYQRTNLKLKEFLILFYLPKEVYKNIDFVLSAIVKEKGEFFTYQTQCSFLSIVKTAKNILKIYDDVVKKFQLVQTTGGTIVSIEDSYREIKRNLQEIIEENFLKTFIYSGAVELISNYSNKHNVVRFFYCLYYYHHISKNKTNNIDLLTRKYQYMDWKTLFKTICNALFMDDLFKSYQNTSIGFDSKTETIYNQYIQPYTIL